MKSSSRQLCNVYRSILGETPAHFPLAAKCDGLDSDQLYKQVRHSSADTLSEKDVPDSVGDETCFLHSAAIGHGTHAKSAPDSLAMRWWMVRYFRDSPLTSSYRRRHALPCPASSRDTNQPIPLMARVSQIEEESRQGFSTGVGSCVIISGIPPERVDRFSTAFPHPHEATCLPTSSCRLHGDNSGYVWDTCVPPLPTSSAGGTHFQCPINKFSNGTMAVVRSRSVGNRGGSY
ncbi:hypothetical protein J6590_071106 [Homalodisca vitripennis]|nr:hypothetical protein J6590_071106 [Homalodisca vitripennis]